MSIQVDCSVVSTGPAQDGYINVRLSEHPGTNHFRGGRFWFRANKPREREILATALAAMSAQLPVSVELDSVNLNAEPGGNIAGTILTIYMHS